jgi:Ser/Thr protein kinase RdoA (MazF antagonist)
MHPSAVLARMGVASARVRLIVAARNAHWRVTTPSGRAVLRRYAADRSPADVEYELRVLDQLAARRWPVPLPLAPPVVLDGSSWCLFSFLPGRPPAPRSASGRRREQRARGRLLAALHRDLGDLAIRVQRPGWLRADEGLFDHANGPPAEDVLRAYGRTNRVEATVLRSHAERSASALQALLPDAPSPIVIHGDLTPWNIRYARGALAGILDFDGCHLDLRVADFALAWGGSQHQLLDAYDDAFPLSAVEKELIVPVTQAWFVASAVASLRRGETRSARWAASGLRRLEA